MFQLWNLLIIVGLQRIFIIINGFILRWEQNLELITLIGRKN